MSDIEKENQDIIQELGMIKTGEILKAIYSI